MHIHPPVFEAQAGTFQHRSLILEGTTGIITHCQLCQEPPSARKLMEGSGGKLLAELNDQENCLEHD